MLFLQEAAELRDRLLRVQLELQQLLADQPPPLVWGQREVEQPQLTGFARPPASLLRPPPSTTSDTLTNGIRVVVQRCARRLPAGWLKPKPCATLLCACDTAAPAAPAACRNSAGQLAAAAPGMAAGQLLMGSPAPAVSTRHPPNVRPAVSSFRGSPTQRTAGSTILSTA